MMQNNNQTWLTSGVIALGISGAYSIILVLLRTPYTAGYFTSINPDLFKASLVVHVNLSVLVWLLSVVASIWSLSLSSFPSSKVERSDPEQSPGSFIAHATVYDSAIKPMQHSFFGLNLERLCNNLCIFGTIAMSISPFTGKSLVIMNNYIPMLENLVFAIGLSFFGIGMLIFSVLTFISNLKLVVFTKFTQETTNIVAISSSFIFILAWICFVWSYFNLQKLTKITPIFIDFYYEMLYWSGGHLLQFVYTQALMAAWALLFMVMTKRDMIYKKLYVKILWLNLLLATIGILGHIFYDISDAQFKEFYSLHMKYAGGVAPCLFLLLLIKDFLSGKKFVAPVSFTYAYVAFFASVVLFGAGGLIGALISGINVTIPAHYHGSIVGISVAFMGYAYSFCDLSRNQGKFIRRASLQLYIITIGQIAHISGLAIAGGYGVLRKTPGVEMAMKAKIALGLMGAGGLVAIIGGLMFVIIYAKTITKQASTVKI